MCDEVETKDLRSKPPREAKWFGDRKHPNQSEASRNGLLNEWRMMILVDITIWAAVVVDLFLWKSKEKLIMHALSIYGLDRTKHAIQLCVDELRML